MGVTNKMFLSLAVAVILLALVTPVIGIDPPGEPFKKAKTMALTEGEYRESGGYVLMIEGWGGISYTPVDEGVRLIKGTANENHDMVAYYGKNGKYYVGRMVNGKQEARSVDRSVAVDIVNKYLQEIEAVRGKSK